MAPDKKQYDLVVIGEPFLDTSYECDEAHLSKHGIKKGDAPRKTHEEVAQITQGLTPIAIEHGGSEANSATALAKLGGRACFIGAVGNSEAERDYIDALARDGIETIKLPTMHENAMGSVPTLVDPIDNDRTMLPVFPEKDPFHHAHWPFDVLADTRMVMTSGYVWDPVRHDALKGAFQTVRAHGGKVVFSLASIDRVNQCHAPFTDLIEQDADIILGNEEEIAALYKGKSQSEITHHLCELSASGKTIVMTQAHLGAIIFDGGKAHMVPPKKDVRVVNAVGAGDAFAGGVLFGLARGYSPTHAGMIGSDLAAKVVGRTAARVQPEDVATPATLIDNIVPGASVNLLEHQR